MATSGSYNFGLTAAQLCTRVAKNLGILEAGGTIATNDQTDLLETLNVVAKEFQGTSDLSPGMKVWTRQRVTLFLSKGQQTYSIGPAATDARATTLYGRTTVASAYASGTSLAVTAVSDTTTFPGTTVSMTNGDIIGVVLNDGTISWTTLNGTPGSSPATLTGALSGAAAAGNYVYWFTSRAQRFPNLESAVLRNSSLNDTPLTVYADSEQYDQGVADKYADGQPTALLAEPLRIATRVTLDSQPTDVTSQVLMTVLYPAEDYDTSTDDIAFPQEWYGLLEWEVTLRSCPAYGKTWTAEMEKNWQNANSRARGLNAENSVLYFQAHAY